MFLYKTTKYITDENSSLYYALQRQLDLYPFIKNRLILTEDEMERVINTDGSISNLITTYISVKPKGNLLPEEIFLVGYHVGLALNKIENNINLINN